MPTGTIKSLCNSVGKTSDGVGSFLVLLFRPMYGNRDSGIREIFASGIQNPGDFCMWNPKS